MRHFMCNKGQVPVIFTGQREHHQQGVLDKRQTGRAFQVWLVFFLQCMRSMVCCDDIQISIFERLAEGEPVVYFLNGRIAFDLIAQGRV